jgi:hypothetical protein
MIVRHPSSPARRSASVIRGLTAVLLFAAAAVVAGCGGASVVAPPAASGAATPPPLTALPGGTYTSEGFQPPVTFTVPEGWVKTADAPLYLALRPIENELIGIHLFGNPSAASQDASCPAAAEPGVGGSAKELADWIAARPGLVASTPTLVTVGGLSGLSIDVGLKADWTQACPFANGVPSVPLFNSPAIDHWVVVGNERLRLYLLDVPGGGTVVVDLDAFDGDQVEDLIARSASIVRSLQFDTGSGVGASAAPSLPALPSLPVP